MAQSPRSVIVIGAGSAGSVVARRLADAGVAVTVLEAGGEDTNPAIHDPARAGELWHGPDDWDYHTVPQVHAAGRRLHLPRGKVLGGSHALNAMIWVRGAASDYDRWAELGCAGWAWSDVAPVYRDIETYSGGTSGNRGGDGLLEVTDDYPLAPIHRSLIDAAVEEGLELNSDYNGGWQDGVSKEQVTMREGRRLNTYMAYLKPVRDRVEVHTGCWVHELIVEETDAGPRAVGVRYEQDGDGQGGAVQGGAVQDGAVQGGRMCEVRADEIVLCAGALDSPRILLRSGIGPADELEALGIRPLVDLPGVGGNLHDHWLVPVVCTTERTIGAPAEGVSPTQTHLFWRSRPGLAEPDTQPINFSVPMYQDEMTGPADGFSMMAGLVRPLSRGRLTLAGPGAHDGLTIDPDVLAHPDDVAALTASVAQCRRIAARPALAEAWGARELYPGPEVGDDGLEGYVRGHVVTYHHQVGTCAMGPDAHESTLPAVVNPRLAVHGVAGLRVADASVIPRITTGNTNAPAVMIGERAARFLLAGE